MGRRRPRRASERLTACPGRALPLRYHALGSHRRGRGFLWILGVGVPPPSNGRVLGRTSPQVRRWGRIPIAERRKLSTPAETLATSPKRGFRYVIARSGCHQFCIPSSCRLVRGCSRLQRSRRRGLAACVRHDPRHTARYRTDNAGVQIESYEVWGVGCPHSSTTSALESWGDEEK